MTTPDLVSEDFAFVLTRAVCVVAECIARREHPRIADMAVRTAYSQHNSDTKHCREEPPIRRRTGAIEAVLTRTEKAKRYLANGDPVAAREQLREGLKLLRELEREVKKARKAALCFAE